jgi:hypothetical protein
MSHFSGVGRMEAGRKDPIPHALHLFIHERSGQERGFRPTGPGGPAH